MESPARAAFAEGGLSGLVQPVVGDLDVLEVWVVAYVSHVPTSCRVGGSLPEVRGASSRLRRAGSSVATARLRDPLRKVWRVCAPRGVMCGGGFAGFCFKRGKRRERPGLPFPILAPSPPLLFVLLGGC